MKISAIKKTNNVTNTKPPSTAKAFVQPKLMVNAPGDKYEKEADMIASKVINEQQGIEKERNTAGVIGNSIMMRKDNNGAGINVPDGFISRLSTQQGSGSLLHQEPRSFMENAFSYDFSNVRIHTDNHAISMNQEVNAKAFTYSNDIYFNSGQYNPNTLTGKKFLAHELTHVIQQDNGSSFQGRFLQRQEENEVQPTLTTTLDLSGLSGEELKAEVIEAMESGFVEEAQRLQSELRNRIESLLLSEDINKLSFVEVLQRISAIEFWLNLFPELQSYSYILTDDLRNSLNAKLVRLKLEMQKPVSLKLQSSTNLGGFGLRDLIFELDEMREWQKKIEKAAIDTLYPDPALSQDAKNFIDELDRRIDTDYNVTISAEELQKLSDEDVLGHILHSRKLLSEADDVSDPVYGTIRENLVLLDLVAYQRGIHAAPVPGEYYFQISITRSDGTTIDPTYFEKYVLRTKPEEIRFDLEQMIAREGTFAAEEFVYLLGFNFYHMESEKRGNFSGFPYKEDSSPTVDGLSPEIENALAEYERQLSLLKDENAVFIDEFAKKSDLIMREVLKKSEEEVMKEINKYGIEQGLDPNFILENLLNGTDDLELFRSNEQTEGLRVAAGKLVAKQEQLEKVKTDRAIVAADQLPDQLTNPIDNINKPVTDWQITPLEDYDAMIRGVEREFSLLRNEMEQAHPILASYEKGEGYDLSVLRRIAADSSGMAIVHNKLFETIHNLYTVKKAYEEGDLSRWETDPIMDLTRSQMGVVPFSMRDKIVDEKIEDSKPGPLKAIAIGVLLVGLAILAAPFTMGGSLTLLSGLAFVGELALSAYLIDDAISTYNLRKAETGTHFVKAKALSQQEPSFFWLAVEVVATALPFISAARVFGRMVAASRALRAAATVDEIAVSSRALREAGEAAGLADNVIARAEAEAVAQSVTPALVRGGAEVVSRAQTLVRITEEMGSVVQRASATVEQAIRNGDTVFLNNLMRAADGSTRRTAHLLFRDSAGILRPNRMFYGTAVELEVRRMLGSDPFLSQFVRRGDTLMRIKPRVGKKVFGFIDFVLETGDSNIFLDVTTLGSIERHAARFYGENLLQLTYTYPF